MSALSPRKQSGVPGVREQAQQGQNGANRGSHERDREWAVLVGWVEYLSSQLCILPQIFTFLPGNERLDREKC